MTTVIETLFPAEVITVEATDQMWTGPLLPEEDASLTRAFPKRRREFTAGRLCARQALERLGIHDYALVAGPDRFPVWPEGITGSISHCRDFCGVAVARKGRILAVGLDAERPGPLNEKIVRRICTPNDLAHLDETIMPRNDWAKIIFSAKESVYKCTYPRHRTVLGFHDVELTFHPPTREFTAKMRKGSEALKDATLTGRYAWTEKYVFTGATLTRK